MFTLTRSSFTVNFFIIYPDDRPTVPASRCSDDIKIRSYGRDSKVNITGSQIAKVGQRNCLVFKLNQRRLIRLGLRAMDECIIIRLLGNSVQNRQGRSFATPLPEEMHSAFRKLLASFSQPGIPPFLLASRLAPLHSMPQSATL